MIMHLASRPLRVRNIAFVAPDPSMRRSTTRVANFASLAIWLGLGLIIVPGCGSPGPVMVPVKGTVTYKSVPLTSGVVRFNPVDPKQKDVRAAEGKIGADGAFSLSTFQPGDGALPGDYNVTVTSLPADPNALAKDRAKDLQSVVPEKFADPKTSGLKASVKAGQSSSGLKFDLTD